MTKDQIRANLSIVEHALILNNEIRELQMMLEMIHSRNIVELNLRLHNPSTQKNGNIIEFHDNRLPKEGVRILVTPDLLQALEKQFTEQYTQKTEELKTLRLS